MSLLGEDTFASESARKTDRWACAAAVVAIRLDSFSLPNLAQRMSADAVSGLQFFKHTVLRERRKTDVQELGRNFLLSSADIEHDPTKTQLLAAHLASIEKFYQLVLKNPKWDGSLLGKRIIGDGQVLNFLNTFAKAQHEVLDRLSSVLNVQAYQVASFNAELIRDHFAQAIRSPQNRTADWAYYYHKNKVRQATAASFFNLHNNLMHDEALDEIYADAVILNQWAIDRFLRKIRVLFSSDPKAASYHQQLYGQQLLEIDLLIQIRPAGNSELIVFARTNLTSPDYTILDQTPTRRPQAPINMVFAPIGDE